jgi:hypothetical protein
MHINHFEDQCVDGRIILKWIFKKWDRDMDWINLAQDMEGWRAVVDKIIKLRVLNNEGNFLTDSLLASQEGLSSMNSAS